MFTNFLEPPPIEQLLLLTLTAIATEADPHRSARAEATAYRRSGSPDHCAYAVTRESLIVCQQIVWVGFPSELPAEVVTAAYDFGPAGNYWDGSTALCINHTTVGTLRNKGRATGRLDGLTHTEYPAMDIYLSWEWLNHNGTRTYQINSKTGINLQGVAS